MGTHPIFESDFDCLTEREKMKILALWFGALVSAMTMSCGHNKCAMTHQLSNICEGVKNIKCDRNDVKNQKRTCQEELDIINDNEINLKQNNTALLESNDECIAQLNSTQENLNDQQQLHEQTVESLRLNCSSTTQNLVHNLNSMEQNYTDLSLMHAECIANLSSESTQMASLSTGLSLGFGGILFAVLGGLAVFGLGGALGFVWARKKYNSTDHSKKAAKKLAKQQANGNAIPVAYVIESPRTSDSSPHRFDGRRSCSKPRQLFAVHSGMQPEGPFPIRSFTGRSSHSLDQPDFAERPPSYNSDEELEIAMYQDRIKQLQERHQYEKQNISKEAISRPSF